MIKDTLKMCWKKGWISFLISTFCFLYLLNFTWLKWGHLIVDVGREMYVPLEISLGKLLYRDIFYLYGPFSPYLNSFLFKLFGVHIQSLILDGVITICVVGILIYKISKIYLNVFFSTFAVLTFLFVFAFGYYVYYGNYNFILPYSYPAIHGIMFAMAGLYFFYRSLLKGAKRQKISCCIFLAFTFLCRIEIGIMLAVSIAISLGIYFISQRESFKKALFQTFIYLILPTCCAALVYGLFFVASSGAVQKSNLLDICLANINVENPFTGWLSGSADISGNTAKMLNSFLYYLFFCVLFGAGGFLIPYISKHRAVFLRRFLSFLTGIAVLWLGFILFRKFFAVYDMQYRSLPIICVLAISASLMKFIKGKDRVKNLFMMTISLFSLLMMFRILFRVWAGHYGFYILVPGMVVYHIFFLNIVADTLNTPSAKKFFRFGFTFIFILFMISHLGISRLCYNHRTLKISSPRGNLYIFNNEEGKRLKELLNFLDKNTDRRDSLVVFPEGVALNFLSERRNPLYYYIYLPLDLVGTGVTDEIISAMEDEKIDYVAIVQRDTGEYGYNVFGRDYAQKIPQYLQENYAVYKLFGSFPFTSKNYGIALFKRKT